MNEEGSHGMGHNSGAMDGLTEDQHRALGFYHQGKYNELLTAKKLADANLKVGAKRALADGISVDDIKLLNRLDTPEGEASLRAELNRQLEVARWVGSEIGTQFSLLDEPDRTPLEDRAFAEGKRAGMKGESLNSPYEGAAGIAYSEGWHIGQEALFSIQGLSEARAAAEAAEADAEPGDEGEEPAPKKRGRPKLSDEEKAARKAVKAAAKANGATADASDDPAYDQAIDRAQETEGAADDPFPAAA